MLRGDDAGPGGVSVVLAATPAPRAAATTRPASPRSPGSAALFSFAPPPLRATAPSSSAAEATPG